MSTDPDRLHDDAPPFALGWAMLACALATLTLAWPALSGGFLVSLHSDQYIAGYAFREFAGAALRAGEGFPQWNPYLFSGMPYIDAMHGDIFYPTFWLRTILPTDVAMTWGMILHLWLAGVATYGLFRAHGLGFWPALIGGLGYMLSGQVASLVSPGHDGKLFVSALFPVTLFLLRAGVREGRHWAWGALAMIVGLGVLSPHPQLLQYLLLASGAYALYTALADAGPVARPVALRRLGLALGAVLLGFAIGTIQYLPVADYVEWSPRAGGRDYTYSTSFSMPPEEFLNAIVPQFSGILDAYWGRNRIHFHSEYLGVALLLLAVGGIGSSQRDDRRWVWFWGGTFIVSALWAMGGYTPFYRLVYALVPGTKFFRAPSIIYFVTSFATAALAAYGAQRVLRAEWTTRALVVGAAILGGVSVLALAGVLAPMFGSLAPEDSYRFFELNRTNVSLGGWRSLLALLVALGVIASAKSGRFSARLALPALAGLVVLDAWSIQRHYWQFLPPASEVFATDPAIDAIKADSLPGRVLAFDFQENSEFRDPNLTGDGLMIHGIRNVVGYHGNELGRYQQLYGKDRGPIGLVNPALWNVANVRWLYTDVPDLPAVFEPAQWERVVGPVRNAAGSTIYLYRSVPDRPLAWVAPVIMQRPDDVVSQAVTNPAFPYRSVALFPTDANVRGVEPSAPPEPLVSGVRVASWAPGAITLTLEEPAPEGSALVVSENYYPGWTATVDGRVVEPSRVNLTFIGVPLPPGAREVSLRFESRSFDTGRSVTQIALVVALLLLIAGAVVDRRRPVGG